MKEFKDFNLKKLLGVGGLVAVALVSSYVIKGYLDILRIKQIKKELKKD
tara:strand:+ start:21258 stop:21404 length:147 start_codon:yes stop_codon:yes gene_type:complete